MRIEVPVKKQMGTKMKQALMDYVVFDIETTGLYPSQDKIIELGAAKVCDGKIVDTFSAFVNPGKLLPPKIVELTGITDADVKKAPFIEELFDAFADFAGDSVLLGHNILFDYSFVKTAAQRQKKTFNKEGMDTLRIARRFLTALESRSLGVLCAYYKIDLDAHRALNDAVATHQVYQRMVEQFYPIDQEPFAPRQLAYRVQKDSPITPKQYNYIQMLARRLRLSMANEENVFWLEPIKSFGTERIAVEALSKSEASRLIDCRQSGL